VDVRLKARNEDNDILDDDYEETVSYEIYYDSDDDTSNFSSSDRLTRSEIEDEDYVEINNDYDNDNDFTFEDNRDGDSSDELDEFIKFKRYGSYKIIFEDDENNVSAYKVVHVEGGSNSSDSDVDQFKVETDETNP
jgi:hypothetical protein